MAATHLTEAPLIFVDIFEIILRNMVFEAEFIQNWLHRKSKLTIQDIKWNG